MKPLPTRWNLDDTAFCTAAFCEKCQSSRVHWHSHYLLTLYTGGRGLLTLNGIDREVTAGDAVVLSNVDFHRHTIRDGEELSYYSIKFHYDQCSPQLQELFHAGSFPMCAHFEGQAFAAASSLAHTVCQACDRAGADAGARMSCHLAIELLLVLSSQHRIPDAAAGLFSNIPGPVPTDELHKTNSQMHRALCCIQEHFRDPSLSVPGIAAYVGYTPHHFSKLFRDCFGCSCRDYIQKCRLEFARRLLLSGELSVMQVSQEAGYESLSYFISVFGKMYGCPPGKFVKSRKNSI